MNEIHARFAQEGLVRPREGRVLAGVVAGLGRRFGIDPWPARLLFILILLVIPGSQILDLPAALDPDAERGHRAVRAAGPARPMAGPTPA